LAAYGLQSPGEHVLVLQAVDRGGTMGQATMRLQVYAAAMIAVAGVVPASGGCTTSFAFDGGASRHVLPGQQIIMYRWDFDGGDYDLASPLPTATHVYRRFGSFPVKLLVQDAKAREASTTLTISTVDGNLPPVVLHGGPYFVDKGLAESLVLDARGSFEPDAACTDRIVEYRWDLDGDGVFEHRFPGPQSTLSFAQLGYLPRDVKLTVTLEAEDTLGSKTRVQTTLQLADGTPAAAFRFTPDPSSCGQEVSFDASTSVHPRPGRQIVKYEWDFAYDGAFDVMLATDKPIVKHTFRSMGGQRVALRVTDDGVPPRTDLEEARPMVSGDNLPPVASTGGTIKAAHGEALVLDARASFDPNANCGDAVVSYEWDLNNDVNGNGQFDRSSAQPQLTVPWADVLALRANQAAPADRTGKPSYPVRLRVKDKLDATHVIETLVVFYDPVPVAKPSVRPDTVGCGTDMFFSGLGSFNIHPDRPLQRYVWDFGDGSAVLDTAQAEVAYRYQRMSWVNGAAAPYKAKLTVKDVLGRASQPAEVNATLSFANRPPVADPGGPYVTSRINDAVTPVKLNGGSSFDPDAPCDGITLYEWDTDNDGLFGAQDGNGSPYCLANSDCVGAVIERFGSNQWQNGTRIPVSLRVTDAYGQQTVSEPVYVEVVDTAPPMVQLTSPNGGEILAGRALVSLTYGLISASGGKKVVLQLSVNGTAVTPLDPATGQPLCAGAGCNSVEVDADGTGTMVAASYRFDTRAFASRLDAYRLQVLAYVKTAPELRTTVFSRRAFSIDNEAPTLTIDDARLAQTSGNLVTWRLSTLGRPVVGVRVAGSFNQWSQDNLADEWQLRDGNGDGVWQLTHRLDDGSHQYKLVLFFQDGHKEWWLDPQNPATAPDGYGGLNNVQSVPVSYLLATLEQLSASGTRFVLQGVAVSDSLDASPSLTVTHAGTDQPWSLDRVYPLGTTKMTLMARDWAGNTTAREVAVLIRDTTKPTVGTGPPVTLEATSPAGTPVRLQPMFWDLCDASLQVTATATDAGGQPVAVVKSAVDGSYGGSFPLGESTVVLRADDDSGNFNAASVKVTINDTTPPTIVLPDAMARFAQSAPQGVPSADAPLPSPSPSPNPARASSKEGPGLAKRLLIERDHHEEAEAPTLVSEPR
ncbi:MAG: PKD domain-containing protein, partial [Deltaproteobacteria bacterium]|nr:PKD domain-containing protein [Deltaproteobacteria bacterium]